MRTNADPEEDQVAALVKLGTRVRPESELDLFEKYIQAGAVITHANGFGVCAEGGESERWYKPDGGLTEAVYRLAGDDDERAILARGILEGELVRRGHDYRVIRTTLDRYDQDDLRDLVDADSFGAVAGALEQRFAALPVKSERGRVEPPTSRECGPLPTPDSLVEAVCDRLERGIGRAFLEIGRRIGTASGATNPIRGEVGLMTEDEAIAYLRLDTINISDPRATLRRYRETGQLRGTQVSKRVFYLRDELDAFLKRVTHDNPR